MKRVAFIGTAGSGKSTLTLDVASMLKKRHLNIELITEWIRTDIQMHGPMRSIWEQYRTYFAQKEIEDAVNGEIADYIITDSGTLTPYFYCCLYADHTEARQRLALSDMYRFLLTDLYVKRYDYVFYLGIDQTYKANKNILNDGTRYQTPDQIGRLNDHMRMFFTVLHPVDNIIHLTCPLEDRCQKVIDIISV